jgi:hypothetical protein
VLFDVAVESVATSRLLLSVVWHWVLGIVAQNPDLSAVPECVPRMTGDDHHFFCS